MRWIECPQQLLQGRKRFIVSNVVRKVTLPETAEWGKKRDQFAGSVEGRDTQRDNANKMVGIRQQGPMRTSSRIAVIETGTALKTEQKEVGDFEYAVCGKSREPSRVNGGGNACRECGQTNQWCRLRTEEPTGKEMDDLGEEQSVQCKKRTVV